MILADANIDQVQPQDRGSVTTTGLNPIKSQSEVKHGKSHVMMSEENDEVVMQASS